MAVDICTRLGRRIAELRDAKGLTQTILADRAQLAREHLSELENGNKEMGVRTLERIANALGLSAAELLAEQKALAANRR